MTDEKQSSRFPEKRSVIVTVSYFPGTGSHFHVEMREVASGQEDGRVRFMKFNRDDTARRWVQHIFNEEFSDETHELLFQGHVGNRWFYPEGD